MSNDKKPTEAQPDLEPGALVPELGTEVPAPEETEPEPAGEEIATGEPSLNDLDVDDLEDDEEPEPAIELTPEGEKFFNNVRLTPAQHMDGDPLGDLPAQSR